MYRALACLLLASTVSASAFAQNQQSPEDIRTLFEDVFAPGSMVPYRGAIIQDLVKEGAVLEPIIGGEVADRLANPVKDATSQDVHNLIRLARSFRESGRKSVPGLTSLATGRLVYASEAIEALGQIGAPAQPVTKELAGLLKVGNTPRNVAVLIALGRIGGDDAKRAIETMLSSTDKFDLIAANWAYYRLDRNAPGAAKYLKTSCDLLTTQIHADTTAMISSYKMLAVMGTDSLDVVLPLFTDPTMRVRASQALYAINAGFYDDRFSSPMDLPEIENNLLKLQAEKRKSLASIETALIEAANSDQAGRDQAMELLALLFPHSDAAVAAIMKRLSTATDLRNPAIEALARVGKPALPKLLARYNELPRKQPERGYILAVLVRIDPDSVPDFATLLEPPMPLPGPAMSAIVASAGKAGAQMVVKASRLNGQTPTGQVGDLGSLPPGEASILALMEALGKADNNGAFDLVRALQNVTRRQDLPVLLSELDKLPVSRQGDVVHVVAAQMPRNRTVQLQLLADQSPVKRLIAVCAMTGRPLDEGSAPAFVAQWTKETDPKVLDQMHLTMTGYPKPIVAQQLAACVETLSDQKIHAAFQLLGEMNLPEVSVIVEGLLKAKTATVRACAVQTCHRRHNFDKPWPTSEIEKLANDPDAVVRIALVQTFMLQQHRGVVAPMVLKMLNDPDATVRGAALQTLMSNGDVNQPAPAPPELIALLNDPDPMVRGQAHASRSWSFAAVVSPFREMLAGQRNQQLFALETLQRGAAPALRPDVERLTGSGDPVIRAYAIRALSSFGPDTRLVLMLSRAALRDGDITARSIAKASLQQMRSQMGLARQRTASNVASTMPAGARLPSTARAYPASGPSPQQAAGRTAATTSPTSSPTTSPAVSAGIRQQFGSFVFDDPKNEAERDEVDLARAYAGKVDTALFGRLLERLDSSNPVLAANAAYALETAMRVDATWTLDIHNSARGRSPAIRATLALMVPFKAGQLPSFALDLPQIANGKDRAASLALLASWENRDRQSEAARGMLDDSNAFVRVIAAQRIALRNDTGTADTSEVLTLVLKRIDDPDPFFTQAIRNAPMHAFGDGSVRNDLMSRSQACSEIMQRIDASEPAERATLVRQSQEVAGESPFLVPTWIKLLQDPDPAVRTLAADGLRKYSAIWHKARMPR